MASITERVNRHKIAIVPFCLLGLSLTEDGFGGWSRNLGLTMLSSYLIFQYFAFFYLEFWYSKKLKLRSQDTTLLLDVSNKNDDDKITQFIEYAVLNRYSFFGYKNSSRANLRLFSSVFTTFFILSLLYTLCIGFSIDETNGNPGSLTTLWIAFGGLGISSFILERKNLHEKWIYLAKLYNDIQLQKYDIERTIMELNLAMDLIDMEMWSHRSYRNYFTQIIQKPYATHLGLFPFKTNQDRFVRDTVTETLLPKKVLYEVLYRYKCDLEMHRKFQATKLSEVS